MAIMGDGFLDNLHLAELYSAAPHAWDSVLYLILFVGIAQVTLGRIDHGRGGRAIVASVGSILGTSAGVTAWRAGFTLDALGPIAWLLLAVVVLIVILGLFRGFGSPIPDHQKLFGYHSEPRYTPRRGLGSSNPAPQAQTPSRDPLHAGEVLSDGSEMERLLEVFRGYIGVHGLDRHAGEFLIQIAKTQRRTDRLYTQMLTALARSGWRRDPRKKRLAGDVESIIRAMFRNNALFVEAMRVAEAAIYGGNQQLLREAIVRMQLLEQETVRLAESLREVVARITSRAGLAGTGTNTQGGGAFHHP